MFLAKAMVELLAGDEGGGNAAQASLVEAQDTARWSPPTSWRGLGQTWAWAQPSPPPPSYYTSIYKGSNGQVFVRARKQGKHPVQERSHRTRNAYELWRFWCIHGNGCTIFPL